MPLNPSNTTLEPCSFCHPSSTAASTGTSHLPFPHTRTHLILQLFELSFTRPRKLPHRAAPRTLLSLLCKHFFAFHKRLVCCLPVASTFERSLILSLLSLSSLSWNPYKLHRYSQPPLKRFTLRLTPIMRWLNTLVAVFAAATSARVIKPPYLTLSHLSLTRTS